MAAQQDAWRWLESTRELQSQTYGYDFDALRADPKALAQHIFWNNFAAFVELAELSVEYSWKPWAVDEPFVNRERILAEAVDVGHFTANVLVAIGVTDDEYEAAYKAKQEKNRRRQASGSYSAKKGGLGEGSEAE